MVVEERIWTDGFYQGGIEIKVDGETVVTMCDGEPEDNNLCRNFNDAYRITDLMQRAYEAGVKGEAFTFNSIEGEEEDDE